MAKMNEQLAAWIAGKLPNNHPLHNHFAAIAEDFEHDDDWECQQVLVGLMLDALSEAGCEFQLEGADGEGYHLIKVMTEDSHHWDIIKHGKSRYLAVRAACEAVAEREGDDGSDE